jgi:hypothetical protein
MKKYKKSELVIEYLSHNASTKRKEEIVSQLVQLGFNLDELKDLELLNGKLTKINVPEPGPDLDDKFYSMLENNIKREVSLRMKVSQWLNTFWAPRQLPRLAYAVLLIIFGWFLGHVNQTDTTYENKINYLSSELKEMKLMLSLNLLTQTSPGDRIKGLKNIQNLDKGDSRIINALINSFYTDENVNVRLFALEILTQFSNNPQIRQSLIQSISEQESPIIQLALTDVMIELKAKESVAHFRTLLQQKDLNHSVRTKITESLKILI